MLGLFVAFGAQADSAKTLWPGNGHYYQRVDNPGIASWSNAKLACQSLGAHLATLTSEGEHVFVYGLVSGAPNYGDFALGGSDAAVEGAWKWITGEPWSYSHWGPGQPDNAGGSEHYLVMWFFSDSRTNYWNDTPDSNPTMMGYVCEWDTNNYIGTAKVPDQNGNSYPEDAVLYVDSKTNVHTVLVKDRKSPHAAVGIKLTFAKNNIPPTGLAMLADTNGNGKVEIGVLDMDYSVNIPVVRIKDINNNAAYVRSIRFFQSGMYRSISLAVEQDSNANGSFELTVTARHKNTGKAYTETRDSKTGALLYRNAF